MDTGGQNERNLGKYQSMINVFLKIDSWLELGGCDSREWNALDDSNILYYQRVDLQHGWRQRS